MNLNNIVSRSVKLRWQHRRFDGVYCRAILKRNVSGVPGSGAGKGGGAGGAIREGGGGLGMWGAAREEGYFYDKQRQQLQEMKRKLENEKKKQELDQKKDE